MQSIEAGYMAGGLLIWASASRSSESEELYREMMGHKAVSENIRKSLDTVPVIWTMMTGVRFAQRSHVITGL